MSVSQSAPSPAFIESYRRFFPILNRRLGERPLVYMDSAATTLKPQCVIDAVVRFYSEYTANVHRAVHRLSEEATEAFEFARNRVASFIGAEPREIVFVRSATEALNLVAESLPADAAVAVSDAEHHSNLLPWRKRRVIHLPIDDTGLIDLNRTESILTRERPALVTVSPVGNAFGTRQPADEVASLARGCDAGVMFDLSQVAGHEPIDVNAMECDYACFSGHKMLGPGGVGVLFVRLGCENRLRPLLHGGSMILSVTSTDCEFQPHPWRFEAGTPNIEGVIGLGAACDFLDEIGVENIHRHTESLGRTLRERLSAIPRFRLAGNGSDQAQRICTFSAGGMQAHAVARLLSDRFGIMMRSGYHCAQPLHERCAFPETLRASMHLYNTAGEIDACADALEMISRMPS